MQYFDWSPLKNEQLIAERNVSFEEVVMAIHEGFLLDIIEHSNQDRYPGQKMFVVRLDDYAYLIPFVEDEEKIFLKTIIPSRKATKKYATQAGTNNT